MKTTIDTTTAYGALFDALGAVRHARRVARDEIGVDVPEYEAIRDQLDVAEYALAASARRARFLHPANAASAYLVGEFDTIGDAARHYGFDEQTVVEAVNREREAAELNRTRRDGAGPSPWTNPTGGPSEYDANRTY